ncbi:MAG: hypothetical protein LBT07_02185 [Endomicrobium sp.]|jgi:cell division transport system permease protein|nr:hypothetical protein [Endomicrobium sp.]
MKNKKSKIKLAFKILKFIGIASFCAFCILASNHYYQIKDYASRLSDDVKIIVFFDKNSKDNTSVTAEIEATGIVSVKEYVNARKAYLQAVEKNPFLKNLVGTNDLKAIQAYAVVIPKSIPNEKFLAEMKNMLSGIIGIDELVFDTPLFKHYVKTKNLLLFYLKIFFVFIIVVFILFILKCIFFIIENSENTRKLITNIFLYLSSSAFGFLILWAVCIYVHYPLSIYATPIASIISFTAALGVILE